jgi:hypothetical protein
MGALDGRGHGVLGQQVVRAPAGQHHQVPLVADLPLEPPPILPQAQPGSGTRPASGSAIELREVFSKTVLTMSRRMVQ